MTAGPVVTAGAPPDQTTSYGEQFHTVYDRLIPGGAGPALTAEFLLALVGTPRPTVVELGVGSGRIALPLARRGARVTGVDTSAHLLRIAAATAAAEGLDLRLVEDDIRTWVPDEQADLVLCVCATLGQLHTVEERRRALAVAAAAARPGAAVVVETHSPERVRRLHGGRRTVGLTLPLASLPGGGAPDDGAREFDHAVSELDGDLWRLEHHWREAGTDRTATEYASLVDPAELVALAASVGLVDARIHADWSGAPADPSSPTYICVLRVPGPHTPVDRDRTTHGGEAP